MMCNFHCGLNFLLRKMAPPKKSACAYGANMIMLCSLQTSKEFRVTLLEEGDGSGLERRQKTYKVVIKFAARAVLQRLGHFLAGRQAEAPQETLQVLDTVLRQLSLNIERSYGADCRLYVPENPKNRRRCLMNLLLPMCWPAVVRL